MRKHFLILMLLTLLPLAGWAAGPNVTAAPTAAEPTYDGTAQDLLATAGTASAGATLYYAVVADGVDAPATSAFTTTVPKAMNAGAYDVYYCTKEGEVFSDLAKIDVTIAKAGTVVIEALNPTMVYGGVAPTLTDFYKITSSPAQFTTDGGVATLGAPVDMPDIDVVNAGNKPFSLVAREYVNYNVSLTEPNGTLTIAKKAITVTTADIAAITYGGNPAAFAVNDYSAGLIGSDKLTGTLAFDIKQGDDVITASPLPAGTYNVYPKGLDNDNYAITFESAELVVNQKPLAPGMIAPMAGKTYNGQNQKPTLTVSDGNLLKATDYTFAWEGPDGVIADPNADNAFKKAGTYTVTLSGTLTGNYKTPAGTSAEPVAKATYEIGKKTLYVKTKNVVKTYSGSSAAYAPAADADHLTFVGLETGDAANYTGLAVSLGETAGLTKGIDAGEYPINVTGTLAASLSGNYEVQFGNIGKLTINKKAITLTPNTIEKNYGAADTYVAGVAASGIVTSSADPNYNKPGYVKLTGELATDDAFVGDLTLTRAEGETAGNKTLTASGAVIKNGTTDNTKNYQITYAPGVYKINAGGFTIWADDKTSVFGGELVELTATVDGIPASDAAKIVFNTGAITTDATATSNRGSYVITIDKTKIDFSAIASLYDITAVTVVPGNYVITPAPLKIKAKAQARQVGQTVEAVSADNIEFVTEGVSEEDQEEVIANITLAFSSATCVVPVDGDKKLTVDAKTTGWTGTAAATADKDKGIWVNGIVINPTAYNDLSTANYTLDPDVATGAKAEAGILYVTAEGDFITLPRVAKADFATAAKNTAAATIAANDGKMMTVKLGESLDYLAEKWYSIVLPFDTDVKTVSQAFGYAVVDVFDKENSNGTDVRFKLHMQKLPANEPFLVKIYQKKNNNTVQFENVIIKNATAPEIADAYGNKFVGTYAGKNGGFNSDKDYVFGMGADKNSYDPAGANFYVRPLGAWVSFKDAQTASAPHMIYIEEPDGTSTSINVATRESIAKNAEGWYNLNGVKLNAAPTEKGVYIQNGKKVVIK